MSVTEVKDGRDMPELPKDAPYSSIALIPRSWGWACPRR